MHREYKDWVVKVYVREGEGIEKESEVYRRIEIILLIQSLYIKEKIS